MNTKAICGSCGRKGRRTCPGLECGFICTACCGTKRGSQINCPSACPHNPFGAGNYDAWLDVDGVWQNKLADFIEHHVDEQTLSRLMQTFAGGRALRSEDDVLSVSSIVFHYLLVYGDGELHYSIADLWEEKHWAGLNNDERVMMRYRRNSYPSLIEITRVLDDQAMECVDQFDPDLKPFIMYDRSTASQVARFTWFLVWVTHYPHFSRMAGAALHIADAIREPLKEQILNGAKQAYGETEPEALRLFIADHFGELYEDVHRMHRSHFDQLVASMDAHVCRAMYRITGSHPAIQQVLESQPDFEQIDEEDGSGTALTFQWLRRGASKELEQQLIPSFRHAEGEDTVGIIGTVRLAANELMIETMTKRAFAFAKDQLSAYVGDHIEPAGESVVDIAKQARDRVLDPEAPRPAYASPAPLPEGVDEEALTKAFYDQRYLKFLDEKIPMLDGWTPRAASQAPEKRDQLVALIKSHLHEIDRMNREKGFAIRIDGTLRALGLEMLI